ncbi:MAG: pesticidal protein Cry15Aa [Acidobacteria bacterium]|nr:pesticidal protein Cry15Aa [Acidobacteriota bacterium]
MSVRQALGWGLVLVALTTAQTMAAQAWVIGPWVRPTSGPVIVPDKTASFTDPITKQKTYWEALHTFNPAAAIAPDGKVAVVFRAEDASGVDAIGGHVSRLGLALSKNGLEFKVQPTPVLYMENDAQKANEYEGGVEDPRIVMAPDGTYVMTYTQYPRGHGPYRVGIATSKDLETWTKWGPAFGMGKDYDSLMYKSAGILTKLRNGRLTAVKLHGKYWMYWGEIQVRLATSEDLIHWTPVLDAATKQPEVVLKARAGHFDSAFPEVGPPPVLTRRGIVLLYNGKNSTGKGTETLAGDPAMAPGAYSVGEALFSRAEPGRLLERTETPVLTPTMPYERSGQYAAGTTFAEGLVAFEGQWMLYYGAADSMVGVARAAMTR